MTSVVRKANSPAYVGTQKRQADPSPGSPGTQERAGPCKSRRQGVLPNSSRAGVRGEPVAHCGDGPGGTCEHIPAFQRWVWELSRASPAGTAESGRTEFSRPFGTSLAAHRHPALKRWAILECPSGTPFNRARRASGTSTPTGLGNTPARGLLHRPVLSPRVRFQHCIGQTITV